MRSRHPVRLYRVEADQDLVCTGAFVRYSLGPDQRTGMVRYSVCQVVGACFSSYRALPCSPPRAQASNLTGHTALRAFKPICGSGSSTANLSGFSVWRLSPTPRSTA